MKNEMLALMAQAEFLEAMCEQSPEVVREIRVIEQRCRSIYDRLDIVHRQTRKSKMEMQPVPLREMVRKALEETEVQLRGIHVRYSASPQQPTIMADPYYFPQAIGNILANAAETLERISEKSRRIDLEQIFQPFFSSKPTATNWGIGLSLCHDIIATHGGKITADSKPGKGTSFHIVMPLLRTSVH